MLRGMAKKDSGQSVVLVGAGSLAHALASLLPKAGYRISEFVIRSKSERRREAEKLAQASRARLATFETASWDAGIIWVAVSDGAIASTAELMAPLADWKGRIVLHSSGALASTELWALKRRGAVVGSVHPMMTFVPEGVPEVSGIAWTIEGDRQATAVARTVVRALKGVQLSIDARNKSLYHVFAAFLSPLIVVHLETAARLAVAAGIPRRELTAVMRPIVEQTIQNYFEKKGSGAGAGKAFSGPLIRGDVATIEGHLRALRWDREALSLYRALVAAALKSDLPVKSKAAIRRAIGEK